MRTIIAGLLLAGSMLIAADVPRQSPEFAFTLPGGKSELLSKHKGKVVLLEFLYTTCPACQKSAVAISKIQAELGPKGFQALGVAINPTPDIAGFTRQYATTYPVGEATRDSAYTYLQQPMMATNFYVPQVVIIDRKGVIRGQYNGTDPFLGANAENNLRNMVQQLLAEPSAKPAPAKPKSAKKVSS